MANTTIYPANASSGYATDSNGYRYRSSDVAGGFSTTDAVRLEERRRSGLDAPTRTTTSATTTATPSATPTKLVETQQQTSQRLDTLLQEMQAAGYQQLRIVGSGADAGIKGVLVKDGVRYETFASLPGTVVRR